MAAYAVSAVGAHPAGMDAGFMSRDDTEEAHMCSVCHEDCDHCPTVRGKRTDVTRFPCHHVFHTDCIVQWLQIANTCPTCRHKVEEEANPAHADNYVEADEDEEEWGKCACRGTCACDEVEGDATASETVDSETMALHATLHQLAGSSPRRGPKMKRPNVGLSRRGLKSRGNKAQIGIAIASPTGGGNGSAPPSPHASEGSSVFETEFSPRNEPADGMDFVGADGRMVSADAEKKALEEALERSKIGEGKDFEEAWEADWEEGETTSCIPQAPPLPQFAALFNKKVGESPRAASTTRANSAELQVPSGIKIGKQVALMFQQVQAELQVSAAMDGIAAITIQAAYRGWAGRNLLVEQHDASTRIQAVARGMLCRKAEGNNSTESWNLGVDERRNSGSSVFTDEDQLLRDIDQLDLDRSPNSGSAVDDYSPTQREEYERMGSFSSDCSSGTGVSSVSSDGSMGLGHFSGYATTEHAQMRLHLDLHLDVDLATELAIAATAPPETYVPAVCDGPCDGEGPSPLAVAPPPIGLNSEPPSPMCQPMTPQSPSIDALLSAPVGFQDPRIHTRKFSESQLAEVRRSTGRKLKGAMPSAFGGKVRLDEEAVIDAEADAGGGSSGIPDLLPILEIEAQLATSAFTAPKKKGLLRRLTPGGGGKSSSGGGKSTSSGGGKPSGGGKRSKKSKSRNSGPRETELAPQVEAPPVVSPRPGAVTPTLTVEAANAALAASKAAAQQAQTPAAPAAPLRACPSPQQC